MGEQSKIQWCDSTWNPWRGCTQVSAGCANCYADRLCNRFGIKFGRGEERVLSKSAAFNAPLRWNERPWVCDCGQEFRNPILANNHPHVLGYGTCFFQHLHRRRVFLGSLMDIFDPEVPAEWLALALDVVRRCDQLDWLLVTKRPEMFEKRTCLAMDNARKHSPGGDAVYSWLFSWLDGNPPTNVTILASVENQEMADKRIPELLRIPARRHGLSIEPLLGAVDLNFGVVKDDDLNWVIVGGESGPKARPCSIEWIRSIVQQCAAAEVPCFVKQLGSNPILPRKQKTRTGIDGGGIVFTTKRWTLADPKGADPAEWPADLRVREWMDDV